VDVTCGPYIADSGNGRVRRVSNGVIATVAGGGSPLGDNRPAISALSKHPSGVAVDLAGNVLIVDPLDPRVREVSKGIIATVVGNGMSGFGGDMGPATVLN
jgi:hypothetical protein